MNLKYTIVARTIMSNDLGDRARLGLLKNFSAKGSNLSIERVGASKLRRRKERGSL